MLAFNREVICNLTLTAIIVVLLVRRYLQYQENQALQKAAEEAENAPPPRRAMPTPTAIPGPPVMRAILGKCKHFKGGNSMEFCGFRSVKQITGAGSHYMGFWGKWITEDLPDGKKKYIGQQYSNGENCPGFGNRNTKVVFVCKETAKEMELVKDEEPVPCQYTLTVAYAGWCEVEKEWAPAA